MTRAVVGGKRFDGKQKKFVSSKSVVFNEEKIIGLDINYDNATEIFHLKDEIISASLIDAHTHHEPSMLRVEEYINAAFKHGTATLILDAHDTANAGGEEGLLKLAKLLHSYNDNIKLSLCLCVPPAFGYEDSFETFNKEKVLRLLSTKYFYAIAEVMDVRRILDEEENIVKTLSALPKSLLVDGHAPSLNFDSLKRYKEITNAHSCHEITSKEDFQNKCSLNFNIGIRYPLQDYSFEKDDFFDESGKLRENIFLCSDGLTSAKFLKKHHLNAGCAYFSKIIGAENALYLATVAPAKLFKLEDRGFLEEGLKSNISVFNPSSFECIHSFVNGIENYSIAHEKTEKQKFICPVILKEEYESRLENINKANVISVLKNSLCTKHEVEEAPLKNKNIFIASVQNRYTKEKDFALGFVKADITFEGSISISAAQDTGNIVSISTNTQDLEITAKEIIKQFGGIAYANKGELKAFVGLQINGITSNETIDTFLRQLGEFEKRALKNKSLEEILCILTLSIPLSVFPELKLTNRGLYSYNENKFINLRVN